MPEQQGFISFDIWTALFVLLNTVTMFLVLKHFLFQPVLKIIKDRQDEIDGMYRDADEAKASADALEAEYQQKLSVAAQTGERIVREAVEREEEIIRQANAEAAAIMDKAVADIAQEKKKALNDAKNEISGLAMAIAEKVVGHVLTDGDQADLVEKFIDELGDEA